MLGGLTVLFFLPAPISTAHAGLAEIFFCLVVAIALFTSPRWLDGDTRVDDQRCAGWPRSTTALVYTQILVGAAMRHTDAGLAIPDFPLMFGQMVPDHWDPKIAVHFAHRVGALVVTCRSSRRRRMSGLAAPAAAVCPGPAALLMALVVVQVTLGALTILTRRDVWINSFHVVCGALVLATSLVLTLRSWRVRFALDRISPGLMLDSSRLDSVGGAARDRGRAVSHRSARVKEARATRRRSRWVRWDRPPVDGVCPTTWR